MTTAVITTVSGRRDHLRRQRWGLQDATLRPDLHVVVAMGDPTLPAELAADATGLPTLVVPVECADLGLPLAAARNAGAAAALTAGAQTLIFLDVDCVPDAGLVQRYTEVAASGSADALWCGAVAYLPPPPAGGYRLDEIRHRVGAHPARPSPLDDEIVAGGEHRLFWSLSFAVTATAWDRIGGFWPGYTGYGAEDTDFGARAAELGIPLHWVGGAWAYHQHHPTSKPPVQHLADIIRNAGLFYDRWGWWPMEGWLAEFEQLGLARVDPATGRWVVAGSPDAPGSQGVGSGGRPG